MREKVFERWLPILGWTLSISPFAIYFLKYPLAPGRDWNYFNSLGQVLKTYILSGNFPLLEYWVCGGTDLLANPQNWIFSPFILLTVLLPSHLANLFSLLVCSCLGFWGMMTLLREREDKIESVLVSALFVLSPFFSLHFIEGHVIYRTFYLLPWVLYFASLKTVKDLFYLSSILTLMFLDGGLYPFYFSLIILVFYVNYRGLFNLLRNRQHLKDVLYLCSATTFLLLAKVIPVLSVHAGRRPEFETTSYSFDALLYAFYNIKQTNMFAIEDMPYFAHEYSHYLGFSFSILFVLCLKEFRKQKRLIGLALVFLWMALGLGGDVNPWTLIKAIPFVNHLHVQSRFLIVFFLLSLVIISKLELKRAIKRGLLGACLIELLFCSISVNTQGFATTTDSTKLKVYRQVKGAQSYVRYMAKPAVYRSGHLSYACYEPAKKTILRTLRLFEGKGVETLSADFNLNEVLIKSPTPITGPVLLNVAWLGGWDCENCESYENHGVIEVKSASPTQALRLKYNPYHFQFSLVCFLVGVALLLFARRRIRL